MPCLSAQVTSVRKRGAFPGQQFNLDGDDEDEDGDDTAVLERKVHGANMPESALRVCLKELKRWVLAPVKPSATLLSQNNHTQLFVFAVVITSEMYLKASFQ